MTLSISGQHYEYAVRKGLDLIDEVVVLLHTSYPDYLGNHFGSPAE